MTLSKRLLDIGLALLLALILALPFMILLAYLAIVEGRPLFYVAERMKAPGKPFALWKLRTMKVAKADSGVSGGDKCTRITADGSLSAPRTSG